MKINIIIMVHIIIPIIPSTIIIILELMITFTSGGHPDDDGWKELGLIWLCTAAAPYIPPNELMMMMMME